MRGEATAWIPVLEANQGTLSLLALIATLVLAYMEFRRANKAEAARILEPAHVALEILDNAIRFTETGKASESAAREAIKRGKEAQGPMAQISGAAIPSASLLIAMNLAVEAIDGLSQDMVAEDTERRQKACESRLQRLTEARKSINSIAKKYGGGTNP